MWNYGVAAVAVEYERDAVVIGVEALAMSSESTLVGLY